MDTGPGAALALNFQMAAHRGLCLLASASVLGLQLLMPAFLLVEAAAPRSGALPVAFWLAMSFHAGNLALWRINFFGSWCPALVALLAPTAQLDPAALWRSVRGDASALPVCCLLLVYFAMQLGHACDEASERLARACRAAVAGWSGAAAALRPAALALLDVFEFHLLGTRGEPARATRTGRWRARRDRRRILTLRPAPSLLPSRGLLHRLLVRVRRRRGRAPPCACEHDLTPSRRPAGWTNTRWSTR